MKEIIEATCKTCGSKLHFEIIERPWNGQRELIVEPCTECMDRNYELGVEEGEE